jgi:hypothetical protein
MLNLGGIWKKRVGNLGQVHSSMAEFISFRDFVKGNLKL